jgi:hypothetical protein
MATIGELLGGQLPSGTEGFAIRTNPDGSRHVNLQGPGAHVSWDVGANGQVSGWHGTIHDQLGQGEKLIVEPK